MVKHSQESDSGQPLNKMLKTNLQCFHCGKHPVAINAVIDNASETLEEMKQKDKVVMSWECRHCNKMNYFKIAWEPLFDKFIS